jgi:hypothetical protein
VLALLLGLHLLAELDVLEGGIPRLLLVCKGLVRPRERVCGGEGEGGWGWGEGGVRVLG